MNREPKPFEPKIILCVAAHPDDLEFGCSGGVAAWVNQGVEVHYLICTDASKGTDDRTISSADLIELRRTEQRAACKILGVKTVTFLDYEDGVVEATPALKMDIARVIRRVKPDTVVMNDPQFMYNASFGVINHNDHRKVAEAAMDAVYPLARDHLSFPALLAEGYEPHKVAEVLIMGFGQGTYHVDITETYETKLKALAAHASQVDVEGVSPMLEAMSRESGKQGGFEMAETFTRLSLFI